MSSVVSAQREKGASLVAPLKMSPFLVIAFVGMAVLIIYMVGIEPMPVFHDTFHDLRHGAGFPCH